jgi:hypothetical protein
VYSIDYAKIRPFPIQGVATCLKFQWALLELRGKYCRPGNEAGGGLLCRNYATVARWPKYQLLLPLLSSLHWSKQTLGWHRPDKKPGIHFMTTEPNAVSLLSACSYLLTFYSYHQRFFYVRTLQSSLITVAGYSCWFDCLYNNSSWARLLRFLAS